ncbi:hypothetical protein NL435_27625, partial [Klebsiella pneumoniae]|nr:hypothetical protein [Klebsiella pneumoniae]
ERLGGLSHIAKEPLSRNLWAIMREFNVLPTEQRFKDLDDYQIEFILANMNLDTKEMMEARDGKNYDMKAEDVDTSWFEAP